MAQHGLSIQQNQENVVIKQKRALKCDIAPSTKAQFWLLEAHSRLSIIHTYGMVGSEDTSELHYNTDDMI